MAKIIPITKAEDLIPKGPYCYSELEQDVNDPMIFNVIGRCPFWSIDKTKPEQMAGYCSYLKLGDWMDNGTMMLFDSVKECGIGEEDEL